jgi:hypothetical protein
MTFYLAQAVGLGDKLTNLGGPKNTTAAFALAWFAQQVDDNRLTSPVVKKNVVNESLQFWHFYSADLLIFAREKTSYANSNGTLAWRMKEISN